MRNLRRFLPNSMPPRLSCRMGKPRLSRLVKNHGDKFGYVVQLEHIDFIVPDSGKAATKDYRVTMIFRREKDGWRLIHRQADSQMTKQAPQ
mgnify:CR=1 FL=1